MPGFSHCTRHTWATMALGAGKSVRSVADQHGHSDPTLTLRVYAQAMPEEEADLSFAEFGSPKRPYTAVGSQNRSASESLSFSLRRSLDQRPMVVRIQTKIQSRNGQ